MKNFLSLVLGVLLAIPAIGQGTRLEGTAKDEATGEPIVGATVALYQNGVLVKGVMTDSEGHFSIEAIPQGIYDIEFRPIGFNILRMKIQMNHDSVKKLDVNLHPYFVPDPGLIIHVRSPLIYIDNITQGRVFRSEEIRRLPFR